MTQNYRNTKNTQGLRNQQVYGNGAEDNVIQPSIEAHDLDRRIESPNNRGYHSILPHFKAELAEKVKNGNDHSIPLGVQATEIDRGRQYDEDIRRARLDF